MTRAHHGYYENRDKPEATCWCQPLPVPQFPDHVPCDHYPALIYHRSDKGMVFWDYGEQGPQLEAWMVDAYWALVR